MTSQSSVITYWLLALLLLLPVPRTYTVPKSPPSLPHSNFYTVTTSTSFFYFFRPQFLTPSLLSSSYISSYPSLSYTNTICLSHSFLSFSSFSDFGFAPLKSRQSPNSDFWTEKKNLFLVLTSNWPPICSLLGHSGLKMKKSITLIIFHCIRIEDRSLDGVKKLSSSAAREM